MRRCILSEEEVYWSGFLIDLDVQDALPLFKEARITRYRKDPETVHEAWNEFRTIVTRNETDFVRFMLEHSKRDSGKRCQDGWGLLIVPDDKLIRDRLIPTVKNGVTLKGSRIPWNVIGYANLCVSLHDDGSISMRRFRRCVHCGKHSPIREDWYVSLPEIGTRRKSQSA
jgi:hypothetical protein